MYIASYFFRRVSALFFLRYMINIMMQIKISWRIDEPITPFHNTIHRLLWWIDKGCDKLILFSLVFFLQKTTAFDLFGFFLLITI